MQFAPWIKPALMGGVTGAAAVAFLGFTMGGWLTPGSAREQADTMVIDAVASALTPYCVAKASDDPNAHVVLTQLKESSSYLRRNIVADSGWATPLGSEDPDLRLAQSCQLALAARE